MSELQDRRIKFLEALESGRYTQGMGCLVTIYGNGGTNEFCCIGVGLAVSDPEWEESLTASTYTEIDSDNLYFQFRKNYDCNTTELIEMNDVDGESFATIASYLREDWEL